MVKTETYSWKHHYSYNDLCITSYIGQNEYAAAEQTGPIRIHGITIKVIVIQILMVGAVFFFNNDSLTYSNVPLHGLNRLLCANIIMHG